ncbi:MAG: Swarming motility protein ybiA [Candidatus Nomurabacteria bacterium GW2011_GWB1_37_5]|uniref:Swarming motility protein ybiA n=1 Tax=Candidatus Nomurabacteria bacterium GW2011_GWB1_37_5 TaxID=1618742 RepID=A0A0G0GWP2_9BACT|nr:MAG: Swarming motility protein ybiA [Candidatus Nomurabacteria bacterium GW2011_GWB1_37_5]
MNKIEVFRGEYRFLSNFWPVNIEYDGMTYPTVEHAYQAAKSDNCFVREEIQGLPTPGKAKKYSYGIKKRPEWNIEYKIQIMKELVTQKFLFNEPLLTQKLLQTENAEIIEGNEHDDDFWGKVWRKGKWRGSNHLGIILMDVRNLLQLMKKDLSLIIQQNKGLSSVDLVKLLEISEKDLFMRRITFGI